MHSPTKIRFYGQELGITSHASSPDGTIHMTCKPESITPESIQIFEGDTLLSNARITGFTIELVAKPDVPV